MEEGEVAAEVVNELSTEPEASSNTYKCGECQKSFGIKRSLKIHMKKSHKSTEYICDICHQVCGNKSGLTQHILYAHGDLSKYKCEICDATFKGQEELVRHATIHYTNLESQRSKCPDCESTFATVSEMLDHLHVKHLNNYNPTEKRPHTSVVDIPMEDDMEIIEQGSPAPLARSVAETTRVTISPQVSTGFVPSTAELTRMSVSPRISTGLPTTPRVPVGGTSGPLRSRILAAASSQVQDVPNPWATPPSTPPSTTKLRCPECDQPFKSELVYLHHIRLHAKLDLMVCHRCRKLFTDYAQFISHKH